MKLKNVLIVVKDIERSRQFYVYAVFCFIREYNGSPDQIVSDHCLIQMPLPGHLLMPFDRIIFRGTIAFYSAYINICFKSSDRHCYDFFYLICLCFDKIFYHPMNKELLMEDCMCEPCEAGGSYDINMEPDDIEVSDTVTVIWELG